MRLSMTLLCAFVVLMGCETEKDRAIKEAKNRPPDAGMAVAPYPKEATLLTAGQNVPRDLHVDGSHLYWLNEGHRAEGKAGVFRCDKNGGEAETLLEGKGFVGITVAGDFVFAANAMNDQVLKVPKSGGNSETVLELGGPSAISNDGTNVYVMSEDGVVKVPVAGGKPQVVVEGGAGAQGFIVEGGSAFWYSPISGKLYKIGLASKKGSPFIEQEATLHQFVANNGEVIWALGNDNRVELRKLSTGGGGKATVVTTGQRIPIGMFADASDVYWTTGDEVMKVARAGGSATTVVKGTDRSISVATDDGYVYWTDRFGRIQRVRK